MRKKLLFIILGMAVMSFIGLGLVQNASAAMYSTFIGKIQTADDNPNMIIVYDTRSEVRQAFFLHSDTLEGFNNGDTVRVIYQRPDALPLAINRTLY